MFPLFLPFCALKGRPRPLVAHAVTSLGNGTVPKGKLANWNWPGQPELTFFNAVQAASPWLIKHTTSLRIHFQKWLEPWLWFVCSYFRSFCSFVHSCVRLFTNDWTKTKSNRTEWTSDSSSNAELFGVFLINCVIVNCVHPFSLLHFDHCLFNALGSFGLCSVAFGYI